jgi:hypothetical protein
MKNPVLEVEILKYPFVSLTNLITKSSKIRYLEYMNSVRNVQRFGNSVLGD